MASSIDLTRRPSGFLRGSPPGGPVGALLEEAGFGRVRRQPHKSCAGETHEGRERRVCYYAICALSKKVTENLLSEYLSRGRYFYNVVALLDRALYAPKILREAFIKQEREFFEKGSYA